MDEIIQIATAAPGWWLHYDNRHEGGYEWEAPIALWALVEDDDGQRRIFPVEPSSEGRGWDGLPEPWRHAIVYRPDGPAPGMWSAPTGEQTPLA